ncbi:MAG: hypothetical protein M0026_06260 [Nocardiopsaceae bacterium]|nr:hypothetical protein [Nocardiopsaceae bacterium]
MTSHPVSKDDVAASLATRQELGSEYNDAVADSLAQRLDQTIEERVREQVERQVAQRLADAPVSRTQQGGSNSTIAISSTAFFSLIFGTPASLFALETSPFAFAIVWIALAAINITLILGLTRRPG